VAGVIRVSQCDTVMAVRHSSVILAHDHLAKVRVNGGRAALVEGDAHSAL